jgi:hypothetical protein
LIERTFFTFLTRSQACDLLDLRFLSIAVRWYDRVEVGRDVSGATAGMEEAYFGEASGSVAKRFELSVSGQEGTGEGR